MIVSETVVVGEEASAGKLCSVGGEEGGLHDSASMRISSAFN